MTGRELLELAAKAAGYDIDWNDWRDCGSHIEYRMRGTTRYWNPLTPRDGAEMEDKLRITVVREIDVVISSIGLLWCAEIYRDHLDEGTARRWASLRVAAAIGRAMK